MREVQLYINNQRVDLFKDEKIQITSTIQNIQDISKVFTDFSQSFTVPCSRNNNIIFDYFYNNDVDGSFKAKELADARIEINNVPFRKGKVQLEGSEIKNNKAESYKITFYGDVVTLKDLFGDDKLIDLDYSDIAFEYTGDNVRDTLTDTSDIPVRFPLISSERVWEYGVGGAEDISTSGGRIVFNELFPAIKDKAIIDAIELKYGVTFSGNFLDSEYFQKSFTYWKNAKESNITSSPKQLDFDDDDDPSPLVNSTFENNFIDASYLAALDNAVVSGIPYHTMKVEVIVSTATHYYLDIFKNGTLFATQTGYTSGLHTIGLVQNSTSLSDEYTLQVRLQGGIGTVTGNVYYTFQYQAIENGTGLQAGQTLSWSTTINSVFLDNDLDFNISAPDITVSDWFSGILKEFNLTCYPLDADLDFQVEPLEQWYNYGGEVDITPYTEIESIQVDRPKLYKNISFEWQDTKAFLNESFEGFFGRKYGELKEQFEYNGGDFKVKLPFENMLFNKFTNTDLQVSYCLDSGVDGKSYIPKPVKLFLDESVACSFYFYDSSAANEVTSYVPFGQDQVYNLQDYSQNFGLDISSLKLDPINNSLYKTFYEAYIQNLFNDKTRQVTVKCHLPLEMLTLLTLDDAVILRDKKYRINEMKTELTSGEVELVLLSDWIVETGVVPAPVEPVTGDGGIIVVPVKPIKPSKPTTKYDGGGGSVIVGAPLETAFVTGTPSLPATFTGEATLKIDVSENTTGAERIQTIPITYYDAQGNVMKTNYMTITQKTNDSYLLKEDGSYLLLEDLGRIIL